MISEQACFDLLDLYEKAIHLLDVEAKRDTFLTPYRSKYAAKERFGEIKAILRKLRDPDDETQTIPDEMRKTLTFAEAGVEYYIGQICIDTEELTTGRDHLLATLELLGESSISADCILTSVRTLNQLGYVYSLLGSMDLPGEYLHRAETQYQEYKSSDGREPLDLRELILSLTGKEIPTQESGEDSVKNSVKLERLHTHTLYYLAQVYSCLNESSKAAGYCHATLKRQLESEEFDPIDWSTNAAILSNFFVSDNDYPSARHHLACASLIFADHERKLSSEEPAQPLQGAERPDAKLAEQQKAKADIARYWLKYHSRILQASQEQIEQSGETELTEWLNQIQIGGNRRAPLGKDTKSDLRFPSLEVTSWEEKVTCERVTNFSEARDVFLSAQQWAKEAKEHYTLNEYASIHAEIVIEASKLYKSLATFETDEDRQSKMHKRRIDMLEGLLKELNSQYFGELCQQLQYELAEVYSSLVDIKIKRLMTQPSTDQAHNADQRVHDARKINHLVDRSIYFYQEFVNSLQDRSSNQMPDPLPEEVLRPVLLCYFYIGRLHSKVIVPASETSEKLGRLKLSLESYQRFVSYCENHPEAESSVDAELTVCKEMVELIPIQIARLR